MNALRPSRRFRTAAALSAALVIALSAGLAEARAGKSGSSGSRGSRTGDVPAATSTAPNVAQPMQRSAAPSAGQPGAQQPGMANPAAAQRPASGGFFSRGGFMGAVMGGLLGAGIAGLLFGGGFFGGLEGFAGILGFALQVLLVVVLVKLAIGFFRRRQQNAQPAYAGGPNGAPDQRQGLGGLGGPGGGANGGAGGGLGGGLGGLMGGGSAQPAQAQSQRRPSHDDLGVGPDDYAAFQRLLVAVQDAYSREDVAALHTLATPEMVAYFTQDLEASAARGVVNRVTDVTLLQGDLAEAWAEGPVEYATVAMRFSCIDATVERAGGRVVEGNANQPTEATELWTFTRQRGGAWVLSAIQQAQ